MCFCRPSSMVELQFCKLWVIGSNPMDGSFTPLSAGQGLASAGFFNKIWIKNIK